MKNIIFFKFAVSFVFFLFFFKLVPSFYLKFYYLFKTNYSPSIIIITFFLISKCKPCIIEAKASRIIKMPLLNSITSPLINFRFLLWIHHRWQLNTRMYRPLKRSTVKHSSTGFNICLCNIAVPFYFCIFSINIHFFNFC